MSSLTSICICQADTEFQELFAQIFSETTLDEYIDIDVEIITSEPAVCTTHVDWRQECPEKNIAEVLQSENIVLTNALDDEFPDDEQDARKMTASEHPYSLYVVKCFAEIYVIESKLISKWT